MRQTLFYIPHDPFGVKLFGMDGALLYIWVLCGIVGLIVAARKSDWKNALASQLPIFLIVCAAIVFVLPKVEVSVPTDVPGKEKILGLPIRGYGVMVLAGVVSGVAIAVYRGSRVGVHSESILGLAFAMFVTGIVGARVFYVIQYWDQIRGPDVATTFGNIFNFVEGGLVVYGSLIGAIGGFSYFCIRNKLPLLAMADLIAPSLAIGLALGRIGCLMNGCCYGGLCDQSWAISFPEDSPPYFHQKSLGLFYGIKLAEGEQGIYVAEIVSDETLGDSELAVGEVVRTINDETVFSMDEVSRAFAKEESLVTLGLESGRMVSWSIAEKPQQSLPIHPTQIYSSFNALLIFLVALCVYPFRSRDGQVIALTLSLYAVTRFLLEIIRTDESSFYSTGYTISQNISFFMGALLVMLWVYIITSRKKLTVAISASH